MAQHANCAIKSALRIACVGDSLTAGDSLHRYLDTPSVKRCSIADSSCRGNYPLDLADLLGTGFMVKNFGRTGLPLCDGAVPYSCLEPLEIPTWNSASNHSRGGAPLPISLSKADSNATETCLIAMRQASQLLREAMAFEPHVVVLMMGTNDASSPSWSKCGPAGVERALQLVLRALASAPQPPVTLIMPPPPLLGEYNVGSSKPNKCTEMSADGRECAVCGPSLAKPLCFRQDAIRQVRTIITRVVHRLGGIMPAPPLPDGMGGWKSSDAALDAREDAPAHRLEHLHHDCRNAPGELQFVPLRLPPISALYSGPVHLNAIGSALIGCAVFEHITTRCLHTFSGGHVTCPGGLAHAANVRGAAGADARAARFELYCRPLQRAYTHTLSTADLVALRAKLDQASNRTVSNHVFRGAAPAEPL